jgi:hypothetical protein
MTRWRHCRRLASLIAVWIVSLGGVFFLMTEIMGLPSKTVYLFVGVGWSASLIGILIGVIRGFPESKIRPHRSKGELIWFVGGNAIALSLVLLGVWGVHRGAHVSGSIVALVGGILVLHIARRVSGEAPP